MAGLYVHIPFCIKKCAYCDFASYVGRICDAARYFSAMNDEMVAAIPIIEGMTFDSVFIGGGTPSLLTGDQIKNLVENMVRHFTINEGAEITIEANPGTLNEEKLQCYKQVGINRLSIGVQAVQDTLLRILGRVHTFEDCEDAITLAKKCGFQNINVDLMYGLPTQTISDWLETVNWAIDKNVKHISCYSLILEEGTQLYEQERAGKIILPNEEDERTMAQITKDILNCAGYNRYEISNYAINGYESRHNILYWENGEYLGLGSSAHSRLKMQRVANDSDIDAYLGGSKIITDISIEDDMFDSIMLGLRMVRGVDHAVFQARFHKGIVDIWGAAIQKNVKSGLLIADDVGIRLTERGLDLQNTVLMDFMANN